MGRVTVYYETSVRIVAPIERVWAVWRDIERWPEWTPTVRRVHRLDSAPEYVPGADGPAGELAVGDAVSIKQPGAPALTWTVVEWKPNALFAWASATAGLRTIAEHRVERSAAVRGLHGAVGEKAGVTVTLTLRKTGALAGLVSLLTGRRIRRFVDTEAASLKTRCEAA
jgi:uncharacterized membrane protein